MRIGSRARGAVTMCISYWIATINGCSGIVYAAATCCDIAGSSRVGNLVYVTLAVQVGWPASALILAMSASILVITT